MKEIFTRVSQAGTQSGERRMTFVASDATRDSYGTVLLPDGWELDRFNKNPIIGYMHDVHYASDPDAVIGKGRAYVEDERLMVDVEFEPEGMNEKADKVWKKLEFGTLNAVSVGFAALEGRWGEGEEGPGKKNETYYYTRMDLLEVSVVAIPANPNALKNDAGEVDRLSELRQAAIEAATKEDPEPEVDNTNEIARAVAIAEAEILLAGNGNSNH